MRNRVLLTVLFILVFFCDGFALDYSRMIDLGCGSRTVSGDTSGYINSANYYSCVTWPETGKEIVYRIYLDVAGDINADFDYTSADLDIFYWAAAVNWSV